VLRQRRLRVEAARARVHALNRGSGGSWACVPETDCNGDGTGASRTRVRVRVRRGGRKKGLTGGPRLLVREREAGRRRGRGLGACAAGPPRHASDWAREKKKAGPAGLRGGRKGRERAGPAWPQKAGPCKENEKEKEEREIGRPRRRKRGKINAIHMHLNLNLKFKFK
jgi:hypothetical protein